MLLAADIGGTKTHLAVFTAEKGPEVMLAQGRFPSAEYPSLEMIVREFLERENVKIEKAAFAVAGPIAEGRARLTNLPWLVHTEELRKSLGLSSVLLVNDLVAIAFSVPHLAAKDLHTLNEGQPVLCGAIAVVAPGTGLGEAYLTWNGTRYTAHPSEGGHSDFAPTNQPQLELLKFLQTRFGHVSYEWVCSGQGIPNIYEYLRESRSFDEPEWLREELKNAEDPAPVITRAALDLERSCELCTTAMDMFVSILGAEAGNLALSTLATGGVYLGGGIPPIILSLLQKEPFMESFTDKGRMSGLLSGIPVKVILHPNAALFGAAYMLVEKDLNGPEIKTDQNGASI